MIFFDIQYNKILHQNLYIEFKEELLFTNMLKAFHNGYVLADLILRNNLSINSLLKRKKFIKSDHVLFNNYYFVYGFFKVLKSRIVLIKLYY